MGSNEDLASFRAPTPQGLRAWLPALVVLIGMPLLALTTTKYVMIPPMQRAFSPASTGQNANNGVALVSLKKTDAYPGGGINGRILNSSVLLVLANNAFKGEVVKNQDKLTTLAAAALDSKSVAELADPAAKTAFRAQLMTDLNGALGGPIIRELYIAGWPPQ